MKSRPPTARESWYWQAVRRLTMRILSVWVLIILGVVLVVPRLEITVFGMPLAYWLISSLLLIAFLVLVAFYAWSMDRIELEFKRSVENNHDTPGDTHEKQHRGGRPGPD